MATITATKAGNWSDTSVWDLGRIPQAEAEGFYGEVNTDHELF